jgi:CheY-like chemotaxis protein
MKAASPAPEVRVLVVDDSVDAATSLGYLLQLMGAKTAVAFGGEMALRLVRLFQPAVVLIDLRMPGLDGCEVMARARALAECRSGTLFVCFSASRDRQDEERCLRAGFDHFVLKPVDPSQLARILGAAQQRVRESEHEQHKVAPA